MSKAAEYNEVKAHSLVQILHWRVVLLQRDWKFSISVLSQSIVDSADG